jgi:hypothetical protein
MRNLHRILRAALLAATLLAGAGALPAAQASAQTAAAPHPVHATSSPLPRQAPGPKMRTQNRNPRMHLQVRGPRMRTQVRNPRMHIQVPGPRMKTPVRGPRMR